jgi:hypothetical protein
MSAVRSTSGGVGFAGGANGAGNARLQNTGEYIGHLKDRCIMQAGDSLPASRKALGFEQLADGLSNSRKMPDDDSGAEFFDPVGVIALLRERACVSLHDHR